jgi:hypothetical protein
MDLNPHVTFTNRQETCPAVYINNEPLSQAEDVKYLGLHLTDASLGTNISSVRGKTLVPYPQNYSGYLDASQSLT